MAGIPISINNLTLSRIPIFVIGVIAGVLCIRKLTIYQSTTRVLEMVAGIGVIAKIYIVSQYSHEFLWSKMLYWLPFAIITPGLCILLSKIMNKIPQVLSMFFSFLGGISLEIYLTHLLFLKQYSKLITENGISSFPILCWISGVGFILLSFLCGYTLSLIIKFATSEFNSFKDKTKLKSII